MCKNGVGWVFRLEKNFAWDSGRAFDEDHFFFDVDGKLRLIIEKSGRITITRGYAWNGCTPKFCLFDIVIGTPDGVVHAETGRPKAYFASLVHDALYQFADEKSVERQVADAFFFRLLEESEFAPRWIYWGVVRAAGWLARPVTKWWRETSGYGREPADF